MSEELKNEKVWKPECYNCGKLYEKKNLTLGADGELYCESCFSEIWTECESCATVFKKVDASKGADALYYCNYCWNERFACCEICAGTFYLDDLHENSDGKLVCNNPRCNGEANNIFEYSYQPKPAFKKLKWENTLYIGFELEVEPKDVKLMHQDANKFVNFLTKQRIKNNFYLKKDGSIQGFEIVSHPFTLQYAHKKMKLKQILKYLSKSGFTSYDSGRCGLHFHLSAAFFSKIDVIKMRMFFSKNKEWLKKLSKREGIGDNYCQYEDLELKDSLESFSQLGRYWALNLNTDKSTVEVRIFRGTLKENTFTAFLQFMDSLSHFIKDVGINVFAVGNSLKEYFIWLKQTNRYQHLVNYLKEEKLCV